MSPAAGSWDMESIAICVLLLCSCAAARRTRLSSRAGQHLNSKVPEGALEALSDAAEPAMSTMRKTTKSSLTPTIAHNGDTAAAGP
ncbi:hypothetical protein MPRG_28270 [Mycobacterium paragordonae]|uniref:Secreted protein n=1 Tax=Mycobacterium paragordonae TaxID=1389713 RepID=A0ABQ1C530_9MYCO|nr:hypothetical protein MPRG_28270 [Mycobacterium paragordonae]